MKSIDKFLALTVAGALFAVSCERAAEPAPPAPSEEKPAAPAAPKAEPTPPAPAAAPAPVAPSAQTVPQAAKVAERALAATADDAAGGEWLEWGRNGTKNMVSPAKDISIDITSGEIGGDGEITGAKGAKWVAKLGSQAYGTPTVYQGQVFIGTNNEEPRIEACTDVSVLEQWLDQAISAAKLEDVFV